MTKTFREKWLEAVDKKNSVLCAGIDPAEYAMGRGNKGLPEGKSKRDFVLNYIKAVAPYCAAVKPNIQYLQSPGDQSGKRISGTSRRWDKTGDMELLQEAGDLSKSLGLVVIEDKKLADIGSTNEAGMFYANQRADAVTLALYAGNMQEASEQLRKMNLGGIHMCLMTNPQYEREKNMLVPIPDEEKEEYGLDSVYFFGNKVKRYVQLAHDARKFGLDGLVIGTTSHIRESEIKKARQYAGKDMLVLMPGIGEQGGEAEKIWKHFGADKVIVNVGRGLMFPNTNQVSVEEHVAKARYYQGLLNGLRDKV